MAISFPFLLLLGGSFNIATVMTYSISLGLIVDSSFHLIHDYKRNLPDLTIFKRTKMPVIFSNLSLCLLFSFFTFIPFLPIREFGINLSILTVIGLFFDLKVLPLLLKK